MSSHWFDIRILGIKYLVNPVIGISGDIGLVVASSSMPANGSRSSGFVGKVM